MTETQFKNKVLRFLKKELPGAWVFHPSEKYVSGIPDIFILYHALFAAIELKMKPNKATPLQVVMLARIAAAGGITKICYGDTGLDEIRAVCAIIKERSSI
jgi:hypothetical protein